MSQKVPAKDLRDKAEPELLKTLDEFKQELLNLRVQKVTGSNGNKVLGIRTVRKNIARVLTIVNTNRKNKLREEYSGKKYKPLDLRPKLTRAIRRRMTKFEESRQTPRQAKMARHFGLKKYAVMA